MKINVYGMGYVGCVSAACLASRGHHVTGVDIDQTKVDIINSGRSPIVEPGLEALIGEGVADGRLRATTNGAASAEVFMICVGTPSNGNGSLDLTHLRNVIQQVGTHMKGLVGYHVVNVRSTVLPGTMESVVIPLLEEHSGKKAGIDFGVCMNPEFMREGTAIYDYFNPPFILIGEADKVSGDFIEQIYRDEEAPLFRKAIRVAEMLKYACNAFHALKVTFANEIGNVCKSLDVDSHEVMDVFCRDTKLNLSEYYLKPGFAFGGSCLPKDLRAILYRAKELDIDVPLLASVLPSNENQVKAAFNIVRKTGKRKVALLGLSFKPDTDDLRESPMVELIERLIGKGYEITIYDKEVSMAKIFGSNRRYIEKVIPHVSSLMKNSPAEALAGSEVVILGSKSAEVEEALSKVMTDMYVIDLVRISRRPEAVNGRYEGICW